MLLFKYKLAKLQNEKNNTKKIRKIIDFFPENPLRKKLISQLLQGSSHCKLMPSCHQRFDDLSNQLIPAIGLAEHIFLLVLESQD